MCVCRRTSIPRWRQAFRLWDALLQRHSAVSPVVQQLFASQRRERLSRQLLQRLSDTTAVRYLATVSTFFDTLEDMGYLLHASCVLSQAVVFDAFMMMVEGQADPEATVDAAPRVDISNQLKALRWYVQALSIPAPDLYQGIFLATKLPEKERRESLPLPLSFVSYLEQLILSPHCKPAIARTAGAILLCVGASLRFSDMQHVRWSSLVLDPTCLRGTSYRTKTGVGVPWICSLDFCNSDRSGPATSWIVHWLSLLSVIWEDVQQQVDDSVDPDCLLFSYADDTNQPASYASGTRILRSFLFLQDYGLSKVSALQYTFHSVTATMLSWMSQLQVNDRSRAEQGHHKLKDSVRLYGRDDVWNSLAAQLQVWDRIRAGWRPHIPIHRGGQLPAQDQPVALQASLRVAPESRCLRSAMGHSQQLKRNQMSLQIQRR